MKTFLLVLFLFVPDAGWQTQKIPVESIQQCVQQGTAFVEKLQPGPDSLGFKAAFGCQVEIDRSV